MSEQPNQNGEALDFRALESAAEEIVERLLQTALPAGRQEAVEAIALLATLNVRITRKIDWLIDEAPENDSRFEILRRMAEAMPYWPTMVRPNDPTASNTRLDRLRVGANCVVPPKSDKNPGRVSTPRNRFIVKQMMRMDSLAKLTSARGDQEAINMVRTNVSEAPEKSAESLLMLMRTVAAGPRTPSNLTNWIIDFVLLTDPGLEDPDLQQALEYDVSYDTKRDQKVPLLKTDRSKVRYQLRQFFRPAVKSCCKK